MVNDEFVGSSFMHVLTVQLGVVRMHFTYSASGKFSHLASEQFRCLCGCCCCCCCVCVCGWVGVLRVLCGCLWVGVLRVSFLFLCVCVCVVYMWVCCVCLGWVGVLRVSFVCVCVCLSVRPSVRPSVCLCYFFYVCFCFVRLLVVHLWLGRGLTDDRCSFRCPALQREVTGAEVPVCHAARLLRH